MEWSFIYCVGKSIKFLFLVIGNQVTISTSNYIEKKKMQTKMVKMIKNEP